jgi:toxin CptA
MRARDKYNERVEAVLGRSFRAEAFVAIGAVATAALLAAMPLALELRAFGLAWIAASAVSALRRLRPGLRLALDARGDIQVGAVAGAIAPGCFVAPWLTIVRWRPAGARLDHTLVLTPDRMPAEDFRRIRVMLRWTR